MRFLVFGLLFLTTAFVAESRSLVKRDTTQDDLVKEIQQIRDTVRKELDKLKAEGKTALGRELQMAEMALTDLEAQARRLEPTTEAGKAMLAKVEEALNKLKEKVEQEIKKLEGGFYAADPTEEALLKQIGDLYDQAIKEIETESKTKKDEVVSGIETAQKVVKDIEDKVNKFQVATDIEKDLVAVFKKLVLKGEDILAGALKSVQSGSALADNKADFIATVKEVYEKAISTLEELDKKDKATLKAELTKLVDLAKQVQKEIDDAIPNIKIAKALIQGIQGLVKDIVAFMEIKLKSVGGFYEADPLEDTLVKQVGDLYDNAKKAIDTLAKTGKDELIKGLETSVKFVESIDDKVKTLKPTTDLEKSLVDLVETLAKKGAEYLSEALKNVQSGTSSTVDHKPELIALVKSVYEKAKTAFETLEKSDKKTLKEHVTKVIALGKQVQTDLKALNPTTEIGKTIFQGVSTLVDEVVAYLEAQLKNIGDYYAADPIEDALLKDVADLYEKAKNQIETEAKTKKDEVVTGIEAAQKVVKDIETKVKALVPSGDSEKQLIGVVEKLIVKGEDILADTLKNVQSGSPLADNKADFVAAVKEVYEKAISVFEELDKKDKATLKAELTKVVDLAKQVQKEIDEAIPKISIGKPMFQGLQTLVKEVVAFLELKLKSVGGYYAADPVEEALLKQVGDLYEQAIKEIETESKTKKDEVVSAIQTAQKVVKDIEDKVNGFHVATDIEKDLVAVFKKLVLKGEDILAGALKSVQSGSALADNKADFIATVKVVYEKAISTLEELDKKDKATLKAELTKLVDLAKQVQKEIDDAIPNIKIAKALIQGIQGLVKDIVAFMEIKLKSVGGFYEADPLEDTLVKQVGDLYDNAKKAIDTLAKTGKDELIKGLETSVKFVESIDDKVKTLKPTTDLEKSLVDLVETLAKKGAEYLSEALKNVQSGTTSTVDHKPELIALVKSVYEKAKTAFETLEKSDKKTLREHVTKVIALGKQVQTDLKALNPTTEIGKTIFQGVSTLVDEVVAYLEAQLKNIGDYYAADPIEDALLKDVADLYEKAKTQIETEAKTKKDEVVTGIEAAQKVVKDIETKVKALVPSGDSEKQLIAVVEKLIVKGEDILADTLKNVQSGSPLADNKADFVAAVKEVYEKAISVFEELDKKDKATLKAELTKVVDLAKQVQKEIDEAIPKISIGKPMFQGLQTLVKEVVAFLELKLKSVGGYYAADPTEEALLKQVGDLYEQAIKEIETESKTKKDEVVSAIQTAQKVVKDIEDKVNGFHVATDIEKDLVAVFKKLVLKGEDILAGALKSVQSGSALADNKADFIATVKEVYEKAISTLDELDKKDKATLKAELTKLVDLAKQVQKEIDDAIPQIKIAKQLFEGVQGLVKDIVAFMEIKLKSVGGF